MQFNFESPYIVKLAKLEFQKTNKITKIQNRAIEEEKRNLQKQKE